MLIIRKRFVPLQRYLKKCNAILKKVTIYLVIQKQNDFSI